MHSDPFLLNTDIRLPLVSLMVPLGLAYIANIIPTTSGCTSKPHSLDLPFTEKRLGPSYHDHGQKFISVLMAKMLQ